MHKLQVCAATNHKVDNIFDIIKTVLLRHKKHMCIYALYFVNTEYLNHFAVTQPLGQVKYKTY
jgi:hypothetical protein